MGYTAYHNGYGKGESLKEACLDLASKNRLFNQYFDPKRMTYGQSRIFDNYEDAALKYG